MTLRARRGGPAGRSFGRIAPVVRCGWRAPANARLALRLEPRLDTKVEAPPADVVIAVDVRPPPGNHVAVGGEGADPVEQIVDAALEPDVGSAEGEIIGGAYRSAERRVGREGGGQG